MANHKSAVKRARQNEKRRERNKIVRTGIKNVTKNVRLVAQKKEDSEIVLKTLNNAKSVIDKAAKKGVIHKNTASRKISRLTKLVNKAAA
ncbi:30S ribosomal protein S20 [Desulfococcaceae bacterium HSG7]|nr:30S ribosomal protein S20 [Desulfococcaceae bacterium HSG9]MDM8556523.1 30S ribosomal protein S20 [Desulfococcaceae bacterium HSG7]